MKDFHKFTQTMKNLNNFAHIYILNAQNHQFISMIFKKTLHMSFASKLLCSNKIMLPFSIWKKSQPLKQNVDTENKKGFLKQMKNNQLKDETKQSMITPIQKQVSSSSFLNEKKRVQKIKIRIRSPLKNSEQFLFQSNFHKKHIDFSKQLEQICQFDSKIFTQHEKQELSAAFKEISKEREKIITQSMTKEKIYEQLIILSKKSEEQIKIRNYISLYNKISDQIQKLLIRSQNQDQQQSELTFKCILNIVSGFNFLQFYTYYLFKLLRIKDKDNISKISVAQASLCWLIVQKLSGMEFEFMNNKMPYDLQRYVQEFFEKKLPFIIDRSKIDNNDGEKYLMNEKTGENVGQQIKLLIKLEKIFHSTHLTYGKHNFYANFLLKHKNTIHILKNDTTQNQKKRFERLVELMNLSIQNMILNHDIIKLFQQMLIQTATYSHTEFYSTEYLSKLLFDSYEKVGAIPDDIYDAFLAEYIYSRVSMEEYHLVQCIKFYVYAQCNDQLLLQSFFSKLDNLINSNQFKTTKRSKHMLHFLFHYLCIKYPNVAKNKVSKKILAFCNSHTTKDLFVLGEIMKSIKLQQNKHQPQRFFSFCIERQSKKIEHNVKSELSTLQQKIFKESLENVITKLNSNSNQNCFYEIKQSFSFCSFQLDFVVLKWESNKKQKLLGYLDTECVGLQYSYDKNECEYDTQTTKRMQKLSLIDYEKGLELIRKKKVRQQILKHYGWMILYVPNKFLYQRHISRQRFEEKLKQAIEIKFSL